MDVAGAGENGRSHDLFGSEGSDDRSGGGADGQCDGAGEIGGELDGDYSLDHYRLSVLQCTRSVVSIQLEIAN